MKQYYLLYAATYYAKTPTGDEHKKVEPRESNFTPAKSDWSLHWDSKFSFDVVRIYE